MKKFLFVIFAACVLAVSCHNEDSSLQDIKKGGYKFDLNIAVGGFENTKANACIGWTSGERIFVFFKPAEGRMLSDAYAEFKYDGESGWTPDSYVASGTLGESGTMAAVYVPYLADGDKPVFNATDASWVIGGGNVYYSCVTGAPYKVEQSTVRGTLSLQIPNGYVQFEVDDIVAAEGDKLACNLVDAYTCVKLQSDFTFKEMEVLSDNLMIGKHENNRVYFWGKMNDGTSQNIEFVVKTANGDIPKIVPAEKVQRNHAYRLLFTNLLKVDVEDKVVNKVKGEVVTANTGTLPAYLRAAIVANCEDVDGIILEPYNVGDITANTDFTLPSNWANYWIYNSTDKMYYYKYIVPADNRTEIDLFTTFTAPAACYTDTNVDHVNMQIVIQGVDAYDNMGDRDPKAGVTEACWPAAIISALSTDEKGIDL